MKVREEINRDTTVREIMEIERDTDGEKSDGERD